MSELKPCPFCGGEAEYLNSETSEWVECSKCGAKGEIELWGTSGNCVYKNWNTRTESTELEQLRKERDELERLADNLLLKCVESDSDIADSDAWHQLERKLKFNQQGE